MSKINFEHVIAGWLRDVSFSENFATNKITATKIQPFRDSSMDNLSWKFKRIKLTQTKLTWKLGTYVVQ